MQFRRIDDKDLVNPKFFYLIERMPELNRMALLDWFSVHERYWLDPDVEDVRGADIIGVAGTKEELYHLRQQFTIHIPKKKTNLSEKELLSSPTEDMYVYGIYLLEDQPNAVMLLKLSDNALEPLYYMYDQFELTEGMIPNYKGKPIITDVGKFLMNSLLLARPFHDLIPYINRTFDPKELDYKVAQLILAKKATRAQYNQYINNGLWYGQDGSICTCSWTRKALITDPKIEQRRNELLEQYKDKLDDPHVIANIEKELIEMDKNWIKGDASEPFYAVTKSKTFNEQRKKMYVMFGMSIGFDKDTNAFSFTPHSLEEGWRAESIATCSNDIRRGSYGRAIETAKGGEQTKYVMRIFQNIRVVEDDCGTKNGIPITITAKNKKSWLNRFLTDGTLLTEDTVGSYVGKTVKLRSPMTCQTPGDHFCYKCCGQNAKNRGIEAIGMDAIIVPSQFLSASMKAMHSSGIGSVPIEDIGRFLIKQS